MDASAVREGSSQMALLKAQFASLGVCALPGAVSLARVGRARDAALTYFADVTHTVTQLGLEETLQAGGFATFKSRDRGRFDMVVPAFVDAFVEREKGLDFLRDDCEKACPWLAAVRALLSPNARLCHVGVILALCDSATQKWHSDGDHCHDELQLPPHALNVFVPLVDVTLANGATEFLPGSHLDWQAPGHRPLVLEAKQGDVLLFDWRLKHRGLANKTRAPRPHTTTA